MSSQASPLKPKLHSQRPLSLKHNPCCAHSVYSARHGKLRLDHGSDKYALGEMIYYWHVNANTLGKTRWYKTKLATECREDGDSFFLFRTEEMILARGHFRERRGSRSLDLKGISVFCYLWS